MKGREMFKSNGEQLLQRFIRDIEGKGILEVPPRMIGRYYFMILAPIKTKNTVSRTKPSKQPKCRKNLAEATVKNNNYAKPDEDTV